MEQTGEEMKRKKGGMEKMKEGMIGEEEETVWDK